ncbi:hypothetical protein PQX77_014432 [Marasmius sp. AFHP31]|nr:hypothetical protein PQX77_014432 [Marasmius sp. AFHP31]
MDSNAYTDQFYLSQNIHESVDFDYSSGLYCFTNNDNDYNYTNGNGNGNGDKNHQHHPQSQSFSPPPAPTPSHRPLLEYIPRRLEHYGPPQTLPPPINFTVNGIPGPYLYQLAPESRSPVIVDKPNDAVSYLLGKSCPATVKVDFDFPGFDIPLRERYRFNTHVTYAGKRKPISRQCLAQKIAERILMTMAGARADLRLNNTKNNNAQSQAHLIDPRWRVENVKTRSVRLVSLWCFGDYWVPVLAIDAVC